jgi:hypothetical protein
MVVALVSCRNGPCRVCLLIYRSLFYIVWFLRIVLTSRLPVTSCIVDTAAIYIMVVKFRNTIWPPPPQLSLHRRAVLSSNSNGTRSVYSRENPKRSLYCDMSVIQPWCRIHSCDASCKVKFVMRECQFQKVEELKLSRVELVWVECHVAESIRR